MVMPSTAYSCVLKSQFYRNAALRTASAHHHFACKLLFVGFKAFATDQE